MKQQRKSYSAELKAKVAIAAIKGQQTLNEIASFYSVHPNQVMTWKKQALESIPESFSSARVDSIEKDEELKSQLYQQIGQLKVELDWVEKKLAYEAPYKCSLIEVNNPQISVRRQCQLLGLNRSGLYHEPQKEREENLLLMRLLDELIWSNYSGHKTLCKMRVCQSRI